MTFAYPMKRWLLCSGRGQKVNVNLGGGVGEWSIDKTFDTLAEAVAAIATTYPHGHDSADWCVIVCQQTGQQIRFRSHYTSWYVHLEHATHPLWRSVGPDVREVPQ